jgi:hypothetical protein
MEKTIVNNVERLIKFAYDIKTDQNQKMLVSKQDLTDLLDCFKVIIRQVSECECSKSRKAIRDYFTELGVVPK